MELAPGLSRPIPQKNSPPGKGAPRCRVKGGFRVQRDKRMPATLDIW